MPSDAGRRWSVAVVGVLLALVAVACQDDDEPAFRVGVVVDCVGINRSLHNAELSGAQLPLIERGARRRGGQALKGITPVSIAGREVELVPGCTEAFEFSMLNTELRRLAELEHVDAIIAAGTGPDQLILREVARRFPRVVFLPVVHGPREATLHRSAPNLFRFAGDYGQGVAGLGTYAYRDLGWRRAAVALSDWDAGWLSRDAFVAEFCALGGQVEDQLAVLMFEPAGRDVERLPPDVDGVAVFAGQFFQAAGFLERLARSVDDPARQIVAGPALMDDPALLGATSPALQGVTGTSYRDPSQLRSYLRAYRRAFPGVPAAVAGGELVTGYRDAMEALVRALQRADGSAKRLPAELRRLQPDLLGGPVSLDTRGQAVVTTSIVRIGQPANGAPEPALTRLSRVRGVDQSIGGLLSPSLRPEHRPSSCTRSRPPPWAGGGAG